ncbi:hypothetical protein B7494_g3600 [Chlorociboria aeruginascens]|nr:hypothetical protein B7494_g3600 [Chlorociboria aeruginascens]
MASLPSSNPNLALHLSDRTLTPLVSSSRPLTSAPNSTSTPQSQSRPQAQAQSLSSLTTAAINAYDSASRLGLGLPQRIMIETTSSGPMILHSFLNPQSSPRQEVRELVNGVGERGIIEQTRDELRPLSRDTMDSEVDGGENFNTEILANGVTSSEENEREEGGEEEEGTGGFPPLLVSTVVAPRAEISGDARRAATRLERMGRDFQRELVRERQERREEGEEDIDDG